MFVAREAFHASVVSVVRLWTAIEAPAKPMLHMAMHLAAGTRAKRLQFCAARAPPAPRVYTYEYSPPRATARIRWFGSPTMTGAWYEEGLNKVLKAVAPNAHRCVFGRRVLTEYNRATDAPAKRRRVDG